MGEATHVLFDDLAASITPDVETAEIAGNLAALMENCVACHNTYRFEVAR